MPPLIWNNYVLVGSDRCDLPPRAGVVQENLTALNRTNGEILWNLKTTAGDWVSLSEFPLMEGEHLEVDKPLTLKQD